MLNTFFLFFFTNSITVVPFDSVSFPSRNLVKERKKEKKHENVWGIDVKLYCVSARHCLYLLVALLTKAFIQATHIPVLTRSINLPLQFLISSPS